MHSSAHSCARHFLEVRTPCHHPPEHVPELRIGLGADLAGVPGFDFGDHLVAQANLVQASRGGEDQLRAPIRGIRTPLYVPEVLELVDEPPDDLLVATAQVRQLRRPDAVLVEIGEHRAVSRMQVVVSRLREPREELLLQREQQPAGEHPEIRVPLLPFAASRGGSHYLRQYQNVTVPRRDQPLSPVEGAPYTALKTSLPRRRMTR